MAVVVALPCAFWAAGGSYGLSDGRAPDIWGMQASRAVGAVVAAAGLLGLAGRWARERGFWLPAALTWVGSAALVAFDLLTVVINRLVYLFGTSPSEAEWAPIDTVLTIRIVIGVLAAVVGILAVKAPRDDQGPAGSWRTDGKTIR